MVSVEAYSSPATAEPDQSLPSGDYLAEAMINDSSLRLSHRGLPQGKVQDVGSMQPGQGDAMPDECHQTERDQNKGHGANPGAIGARFVGGAERRRRCKGIASLRGTEETAAVGPVCKIGSNLVHFGERFQRFGCDLKPSG